MLDEGTGKITAVDKHFYNPTQVIFYLHCPDRALFDIICKNPLTPQRASAVIEFPEVFQSESQVNFLNAPNTQATFLEWIANINPSDAYSKVPPKEGPKFLLNIVNDSFRENDHTCPEIADGL